MFGDTNDTTVRELELTSISKVLQLHQHIKGQVNTVVWDASIVLAKYLDKQNKLKLLNTNTKVVELGSGVGCAGLTAAALGCYVTLTDLPEMLNLLDLNVKHNADVVKSFGGVAQVQALTWGEPSDLTADLILLADCVYYKESIDALISTMLALTDNKTEILQSQEMRDSNKQVETWNYYWDNINEHFNIIEISISEQDDKFSSDDIKLYKLRRK